MRHDNHTLLILTIYTGDVNCYQYTSSTSNCDNVSICILCLRLMWQTVHTGMYVITSDRSQYIDTLTIHTLYFNKGHVIWQTTNISQLQHSTLWDILSVTLVTSSSYLKGLIIHMDYNKFIRCGTLTTRHKYQNITNCWYCSNTGIVEKGTTNVSSSRTKFGLSAGSNVHTNKHVFYLLWCKETLSNVTDVLQIWKTVEINDIDHNKHSAGRYNRMDPLKTSYNINRWWLLSSAKKVKERLTWRRNQSLLTKICKRSLLEDQVFLPDCDFHSALKDQVGS